MPSPIEDRTTLSPEVQLQLAKFITMVVVEKGRLVETVGLEDPRDRFLEIEPTLSMPGLSFYALGPDTYVVQCDEKLNIRGEAFTAELRLGKMIEAVTVRPDLVTHASEIIAREPDKRFLLLQGIGGVYETIAEKSISVEPILGEVV